MYKFIYIYKINMCVYIYLKLFFMILYDYLKKMYIYVIILYNY